MKRNYTRIIALIIFAAMALSLAACGTSDSGGGETAAPVSPPAGGQSTPPPAPPPSNPGEAVAPPPVAQYTGKTHLNWAHGAYPPSMDPTLINDMPGAQVRYLVYSTLFVQDYDMNIHNELAESYEFVNAQTLKVQIKQGVKFHNGQELTAEDVAFSITRASTAPAVAAILNMIDRAEATGPYEVVIYLDKPFAPILAHLAHTASGIVSKEVVERLGDQGHAEAPVGTGPFMVMEQVTGDRIELARFPDYFGGAFGEFPVLETITIRVIPDETMRALEIAAGTVDLISNVGFNDYHRLTNLSEIETYLLPNLSTNFVGFNCQKAPFNDVKVRQAIAYGIDNEALLANVHRGLTTPVNGALADAVWGSISGELAGYPYNPDKALELLEEAGFPNGFKTTIWLNETLERQTIAAIVQAQLRLIGVDVEIQVLEWGAYLEGTANGEHDMFILGWVTVTGDPDYGLFPTYHSSNWGDPGNRARFADARADELIMLGRTETDQAKRLEYYREAQQIISDGVPTMWLNQGSERWATTAGWLGFRLHPAGYHSFHLMHTN